MYVRCNSCSKEYNDLVQGVRYSSTSMGSLLFFQMIAVKII